jgi:aminoglycoside phosphotransferase (APT) family kinase protein
MGTTNLRRRAPSLEALLRLAAVVAPGSRPVNVRRLRGGISAAMHAVDLLQPNGDRLRLVLRRCGPNTAPGHVTSAERATRLYQTLQLVTRLGLPAPRPVLLDQAGEIFGEAAVVMIRLPGRGVLTAGDHDSWLQQLVAALAAIHRAPLDGHDVGFLPGPGRFIDAAFAHARHLSGGDAHPDSAEVMATLRRLRSDITPRPPGLAHGDYWTGNTLWLRGRLQAVVDWEDACIDSPEADVSTCRLDLYLSGGAEAADRFLALYEEATGGPLPAVLLLGSGSRRTRLPRPR